MKQLPGVLVFHTETEVLCEPILELVFSLCSIYRQPDKLLETDMDMHDKLERWTEHTVSRDFIYSTCFSV